MSRLLTTLLLCVTMLARGQVVVNIQIPPAGLYVKNQLWNLSLVNTFPATVLLQVEMVMTDASKGQRVLSGVSKFFHVERGVKMVQISDVTPILYDPGASGYHIDARPDGFLPIGLFNICYVISRINGEAIEKLAEECETVEIEPLSPPQLVMPSDSDCVELVRPVFSWLQPSPANLFNNLKYDWTLVEVQGSQTGGDAIQQNIPVYSQQNIEVTSFQYPLSAPVLDSSRLYAWRIIAKSNDAAVASSDVFTFKTSCITAEKVVPVIPGPYLKLQKTEEGSPGIFTGYIRFEYLNELNDSLAYLKITDITGSQRKQIELDTSHVRLHFGQNLLQIDLNGYSDMRNKHTYMLELLNSAKERWYIRFEYRKPD